MSHAIQFFEPTKEMSSWPIETEGNLDQSPILAAAFFGKTETIEALVRSDKGIIDFQTEEGFTPLHLAAYRGHVSVIETLVRLGSKAIDTPNGLLLHPQPVFHPLRNPAIMRGFTPVHIAAQFGHADVIETLVRLGSKAIDTPNGSLYETPIYTAALWGHAKAVETLVRLGSKAIDTPDSNGSTPMLRATHFGSVDVLATLVRLGSTALDTPNLQGWTPLFNAVHNARAEAVEALIRLGSRDLDAPGRHEHILREAVYSQGLYQGSDDLNKAYQKTRQTIRALSSNPRLDIEAFHLPPFVAASVDEEFIAQVRHRVYFSSSLAHRLLFELERAENELARKLSSNANSKNSKCIVS